MLLATPRHWFSWNFDVLRDNEFVAQVDLAWFRERAELSIARQVYLAQRDSALQGTFSLKLGDEVIASAHKSSLFRRAFDVHAEGRQFRLQAISIWQREFGLFENQIQIGRIYPTHFIGRRSVIDLPDELPLHIQIFLFWLVVVLWRRAAAHSNAAAQ